MADGRNGGMDRVNSKDPYRESVQLCDPCAAYLVGGDFDQLRERFNAERTVRR